MTDYFFVERLGDGLIRVMSAEFGRQLLTQRKLRKPSKCATCMRALEKGAKAWADVTSCAMNRAHRLCDDCVNAGEAALGR